MWVTVIRSSHSPLPEEDLIRCVVGYSLDVGIEFKTGLWRTRLGSHSPTRMCGNPGLNVLGTLLIPRFWTYCGQTGQSARFMTLALVRADQSRAPPGGNR
jgi:hypothetical protein